MSKFPLIEFLKASRELIIVFFQFLIILLHFVQWEFLTKKEIFQVNSAFDLLGFLIIIIALLLMLKAIKDLGSNLSPFPRPKANSKLITSGTYSLMRHPIYFSLILISFGIFIIKLSIYYLCLTISLTLVIKFKIMLEDQYLNIKFNNYFIYKHKVKY